MFFDFEFFLTALVLITGVGFFLDVFVFAKQRAHGAEPTSKYLEYSRSLFPAIFLVWGVRSFFIDHYRVVTGSLEPTIMAGDFVGIKKYAYGERLPVLRKKIIATHEPKVGDVVLFYWPKDESIRYAKRVVATPGDHIVYKNKTLTINGKTMPKKYIAMSMDEEPGRSPVPVSEYEENLAGVKHNIFLRADQPDGKQVDIVIPKGFYFMMGDNRDDSYDSRYWGLVPEKNLIGQAFGVWMSWNSNLGKVRWHRIGTSIH